MKYSARVEYYYIPMLTVEGRLLSEIEWLARPSWPATQYVE